MTDALAGVLARIVAFGTKVAWTASGAIRVTGAVAERHLDEINRDREARALLRAWAQYKLDPDADLTLRIRDRIGKLVRTDAYGPALAIGADLRRGLLVELPSGETRWVRPLATAEGRKEDARAQSYEKSQERDRLRRRGATLPPAPAGRGRSGPKLEGGCHE